MPSQILRKPLAVDLESTLAGASSRPGTLLLESGAGWTGPGRCALLFSPRWTLRVDSNGRPRIQGPAPASWHRADLDCLRRIGRIGRPAPSPPLEPVFCGLAGYVSYELGSARLGAARPRSARFACDDAWLGAYDRALLFRPASADRPAELELLVASHELFGNTREKLGSLWDAAADELREFAAGVPARATTARLGPPRFFDRAWHRDAVHRIGGHLRAGDSYQVNLTGFASADCTADPYLVFRHEAHHNPVEFSAFLRTTDFAISCHSPELLLRLRGDRAETRPIKGTAPIGPEAEDVLRASSKDLAEHVMIVDLCRNDLGRHARYGSVRVEDFAATLRMRNVVHLISRISARLDENRADRVLADLFPAGSITGAPKRRTAQIIGEIEPEIRGPYTGSLGYADLHGNSDWNIAIRTAVWQDRRVHFGCGGGIVLDSDPDLEYEEARWKASSFFDSLRAVISPSSSEPVLSEKEARL